MLISTQALPLHTTNYSETSVIAKVFTRELGVRSYILKGVRGGKSRAKQNMLQPLTPLDMVVYNNPKSSINYVKEISPTQPLPHREGLRVSPMGGNLEGATANALRFFMDELLYKSLREEEPLPELFDYVMSEVSSASTTPASQTPLVFMLQVSRHLGIEPLDNYSHREPYFNLQDGRYVSATSSLTLSASQSTLLHHYLDSLHQHTPLPITTLDQRTQLINSLLQYYQLHLADFRNFKSHEILHTVLS